MRDGRRNYDWNVAGLGKGRAPRYFVSGRDGNSDRLLGVSKIEALEAVESSSAVLHTVIQYSNAVLDLRRIDKRELHEKARIASTG